jgi:hypothetical protein
MGGHDALPFSIAAEDGKWRTFMSRVGKAGKGDKARVATEAESARNLQKRLQERMQTEFDNICGALMKQASEGHYNSAQLLLKMSGLEGATADSALVKAQDGRSFLLDLVDELLIPKPEQKAD